MTHSETLGPGGSAGGPGEQPAKIHPTARDPGIGMGRATKVTANHQR